MNTPTHETYPHSPYSPRRIFLGVLILGILSATKLPAQQQPDITRLSATEINKVQPPPEGLFSVPFHPGVPVPGSKIWGGMLLWWYDGSWYMAYDCWPNPLPLYLLTSKDGVYWKHEGAWFDKDNPDIGVFNPDIYKLRPDGPFVMVYEGKEEVARDAAGIQPNGLFRFATSYDMKQWKRLGPPNGYKNIEEFRKDNSSYRYTHTFHSEMGFPHPDGGWFHLIYAESSEYIGMGYARSTDGIHYNILPPVKFEGVPEDRFNEKPLIGKGGEPGGITKIGSKYFFSGGSRQGDYFLVADRPEGPYRPTPKNHTIPRGPENFWRIYNEVPGGPLITSSCSPTDAQGKRQWMMTPLKRLVSDGESVWIKWWEGNETLKAQPVRLTLKTELNGIAAIEPAIEPQKVTVIEGMIDFSSVKPEVDFATGSKASATMTHTFGPGSLATGAEDYLGAEHLIDGLDERSWIGDLVGVHHANKTFGGMDEKQFAQFLARKTGTPEATIDLGKVLPIGRIEARWTRCPGSLSSAPYRMDYITGTKLSISKDGTAWQEVPVSTLDDYRLNYENLAIGVRYLKFTFPPLNITADKPTTGFMYRVVGLAEVNIFEAGQHDIIRPNGLPGMILRRQGEVDEVMLFDPTGKVLMGEVKRGTTAFRHRETRNIEVPFPAKSKFRLIITDDQVEVYVNDYFIDYIETKTALTGGIGIIRHPAVSDVKVWTANQNVEAK